MSTMYNICIYGYQYKGVCIALALQFWSVYMCMHTYGTLSRCLSTKYSAVYTLCFDCNYSAVTSCLNGNNVCRCEGGKVGNRTVVTRLSLQGWFNWVTPVTLGACTQQRIVNRRPYRSMPRQPSTCLFMSKPSPRSTFKHLIGVQTGHPCSRSSQLLSSSPTLTLIACAEAEIFWQTNVERHRR